MKTRKSHERTVYRNLYQSSIKDVNIFNKYSLGKRSKYQKNRESKIRNILLEKSEKLTANLFIDIIQLVLNYKDL